MRNAIDNFLINAVVGAITILTFAAMLKIFFLLG